jgi:outer membrane protein assembly factor BamB
MKPPPPRLPTTLALLAALLCGAPAARADDWPQWRGANRDAVWREAGIFKAFPAGGPTVRWRAPVEWGWASPVIVGGRVFVADSHQEKPVCEERVLCFDEATGKPLWTHAYGVTYPDWVFTAKGNEGRPSATPVAEGGRLYTLGGNGDVYCLDAASGAVVWHKALQKEFEIEVLKCRASPLIEGDLLIVHTGGKPGASVVALDRHSGALAWKALDDGVSNSSPIVITAGGRRQLIVWTADSVASLDPATGAVYWREPMVTSNNDAIATPVHRGDLLLIGGLMLKLDPDRPAASVLWPQAKAASRRVLSNTSTAVLLGDHVYSARSNGEMVCLEARSGKSVWETDEVTELGSGAAVNITPNGDGGAAFLFTGEGDLIRARLTPDGYKEVGRFRLVEPTCSAMGRNLAWTPPAFANGHVFARNDREVVCVSLKAAP